MTSASSSAQAPATTGRRVSRWLAVVAAALVAVLIGLPEGVAEPLQALLAWAVVATVAVLAVVAIATGLDRLLDCETR